MMRVGFALAFVAACGVAVAGPAEAAKLCGWMIESEAPNDVRNLKIYLSSDAEVDFLWKIGGKGISYPGNTGSSNSSGSFTLHAGQTDSPWSYGQTLEPPGLIDVNIEIHQMPADIFSDKPTPLLANFVFRRNVPENEKKPSAIFAKKQCVTVPTASP
jgi:hypothetical protein